MLDDEIMPQPLCLGPQQSNFLFEAERKTKEEKQKSLRSPDRHKLLVFGIQLRS